MSELDLSWPTPQLAVGAKFPMDEAWRLARELGITHVVDVRGECCDDEHVLRRHGVTLLSLPTQDRCAVSQEMLDHGVTWVRQHLDRGRKVFIHCEYGIGRSALLALCVMTSHGLTPLDALATLKRARWKVSPSPEQLQGYLDWVARHGWEPPPLQSLFEIAYAHLAQGQVGTGSVG